MAGSYWPALALAMMCSVGVATLWGANIAALFPILEVTLQGKSLQVWNIERMAQAKLTIEDHQKRVDELTEEMKTTAEEDLPPLHLECETLKVKISAEQAIIGWGTRMQPTFERWLPDNPFYTIVGIVALVCVSTFLKHVLMIANQMLVLFVAGNTCRKLRKDIFNKALTIERGGFLHHGTAGFSTQILHTAELLANGITNVYGGLVMEPLKIVSCLAGACFISWRLTLASMVMAPVVCVLIVWLNRSIKGTTFRILGRSQSLHHVILETFSNMMCVQSNCMEDQERERFAATTNTMFSAMLRNHFFISLTHPITELLGLGMVNTAIIVGAYLVINQETHIFGIPMSETPMTISKMMVFFGLLIGAADPVRKMSGVWTAINSGIVAANALFPMLDRESLIRDPAEPKKVDGRHRRIEFKDVDFGYIPGEMIIEKVNLEINYGERVAIMGPNGGGKSTLMNLLCRFYDPGQGAVMMDGVDLRDMSLDDLRSRIGLVTQHTELFNESIMYNIRYGRKDASDEEVIEAAKRAHAHEFIVSFSGGYDTVVAQNGLRLSGGQRQRIALARAILRDPEILILDEATSQIDTESERLIHATLEEFCRDRTVLMVTHRQSTLDLADSIIEIRDHRVSKQKLKHKQAA